MAVKQQKDREEHADVEGCITLQTQKRSGGKLDHVASVRTRGGFPCAAGPANMMVQGQKGRQKSRAAQRRQNSLLLSSTRSRGHTAWRTRTRLHTPHVTRARTALRPVTSWLTQY